MKILLVDDDEVFNDTLKRWISRVVPTAEIHQGYSVQDALTLTKQNKYSLCFLDIEIPETSGAKINPLAGLELCKKIYTEYRCTIFMLSARDTAWDVRKAQEYGAKGYILKPPDFKDIEEIVKGLGENGEQ